MASEIPTVPTYDQMLWPALQVYRNAPAGVRNAELLDKVADLLGLSPELRALQHVEGRNSSVTEVAYRLGWTRTYLKMAGAIRNLERGVWEITEEGRKLNETDVALIPSTVKAPKAEDEDVGAISEPFDPHKIRVRLWTPSLDLLVARIKEGEIDLAADFQREARIWNKGAQSRLVESLLIRIPLPAFYMDGEDEDKLVVIDGIQRLTALKNFVINGTLRLKELEFLRELEGKSYQELPRPLKRRIDETMVTVYIVEAGTPDEAKLNIFKRINTGGQPLRAQEIRHAMCPGPVRDVLIELAASESFLAATDNGINDIRMDARECIARYFAFALTPAELYKRADLDGWVLGGMRQVNTLSDTHLATLCEQFERAMLAAADIFGSEAFRKLGDEGQSRRPVNKALFEVWSVLLGRLTPEKLSALVSRRHDLVAAFRLLLAQDRAFVESISQGTGDVAKVKRRFSEIQRIIDEVLA